MFQDDDGSSGGNIGAGNTSKSFSTVILQDLLGGKFHLRSNAESMAEFRLFSELPLELRLTIWKLGFPGPRQVNIHHGIKISRREARRNRVISYINKLARRP
jgi:hypothetical protein